MDVGQYRGSEDPASLPPRMLRFHSTPSLISLPSPYKAKHRHLCTSHTGTHMHTNIHRDTSGAGVCKEKMGMCTDTTQDT